MSFLGQRLKSSGTFSCSLPLFWKSSELAAEDPKVLNGGRPTGCDVPGSLNHHVEEYPHLTFMWAYESNFHCAKPLKCFGLFVTAASVALIHKFRSP